MTLTLFWPGMEVDMELNLMLLSFARQLPFSRPGPLRRGRGGPLTLHPVPAVSLKLEPFVGG